ncbi:diguanylate phosphodiesterase [Aliidongia dinghuensis]|uniref:Diguanylate phosphodiesterase n=1 Tax=Aliidongia dinghuensis TaxID=1867774 RepID=A0A8J2YQX5_9PROT|nr:EAL domain-containing protein [Aliidongia dinghuensis]GGF02778.1 diguanylate phosphodiesterase [Aliidongia dinghuensis]
MPHILKRERDRFVGFAFATAHLLVEIDLAGTVRFAAGASCGLADGPAETLVGQSLDTLVAPADREFMGHLLKRLISTGTIGLTRVRLTSYQGKPIDFILGGRRPLNGGDTLQLGLILASMLARAPEVAGQSEAERFTAAASHRLAVASEAQVEEGMTFLMLNGLQKLADERGPAALAEVLPQLMAYLRSVSAGGELASPLAPGRFGLVRARGVTEAEIVAGIEEILERAALPSPVQVFDLSFDSGGLDEADSARALAYSIRRFSEARPGGFNVRSLKDGATALLSETVKQVAAARRIMAQRRIEVVYQPVVRLTDSRTHHFEALSRISGVASIGPWIRFAEETGLIQDYDLILAEAVLSTMASHEKSGWQPMIAINLSAQSLQSSLFRARFDQITAAHAAQAPRLMIEVTETAGITDYPAMAAILRDLQARGHRLCIDDLGAGSTSLETLRSLPADYVKIDGPFLRAAIEDPREFKTLETVIGMALAHGSEIIVEQIESVDHASVASRIGAHYAQGFLYGRPTTDMIAFGHDNPDPHWQPMPFDKGKKPA